MPMPLQAEPRPAAADLAALMAPADPAPTSQHARLALPPSEPFYLRHHPSNWDADGEGLDEVTWLPDVSKLVLTPGAHLVRTRRKDEDERESFRHSMAEDQNRGWIWLLPEVQIPADCLPRGVPAGGYMRSLPCRDPRTSVSGKAHVEAWQVPAAPVPGRPQRFAFDRAAYNRWRLWLVTSGQVPPPTDDVLREMVAQKAGRPARVAALPLPDDLRRQRVARAEAEVSAMEDASIPAAAAARPAVVVEDPTVKREPLSARGGKAKPTGKAGSKPGGKGKLDPEQKPPAGGEGGAS